MLQFSVDQYLDGQANFQKGSTSKPVKKEKPRDKVEMNKFNMPNYNE
jgi:hypothetical protein